MTFRPWAMTRWAISLSPGCRQVALALDGEGDCGVRRADTRILAATTSRALLTDSGLATIGEKKRHDRFQAIRIVR